MPGTRRRVARLRSTRRARFRASRLTYSPRYRGARRIAHSGRAGPPATLRPHPHSEQGGRKHQLGGGPHRDFIHAATKQHRPQMRQRYDLRNKPEGRIVTYRAYPSVSPATVIRSRRKLIANAVIWIPFDQEPPPPPPITPPARAPRTVPTPGIIARVRPLRRRRPRRYRAPGRFYSSRFVSGRPPATRRRSRALCRCRIRRSCRQRRRLIRR